MKYEILETGSSGNCTIINGTIAVDMGIPYKKLQPYVRDLRLVLLTHWHGDHFNKSTVRRLAKERPTLRWGCTEWLVYFLLEEGVDIRNIDCYEIEDATTYFYGPTTDGAIVQPVRLFHNVPNCGYKIDINGEKLFYATDTGSLDGITAKDYDIYLVEANYTETELRIREKTKLEAGEFSYETAARENHLSYEKAVEWLQANMGPRSIWIPMHEHKEKEKDGGDEDGVVRSAPDAREASENAETFQTDQA